MLNAKKKRRPVDPNRVEQEPIDEGTYPCRVVQIIELGLQPQRPHKGKVKPPVDMMMLTYELTDEFCLDKEGNEDEALPRWQSEDFPYYGVDCKTATCNKRLKAIDPKNEADGNWSQVGGNAVQVTFYHKVKEDKTYVNVSSATPFRPKEVAAVAPLVQPVKIFDIDEPDMEVFYKLPNWLQNKIIDNLNFEGSVLEEAIANYEKPEEEKGEEPKKKVVKKNRKSRNKAPDPEPEEGCDPELDENGDKIPW
jgi:hypothetical protein